ncbi:MAG: hypothetical protein IKQ75_05725 [Bacteroidales bacterium]|nr:hypothetical protein [Bacteroidales bacterium]MBR6161348.1 hypothetical protein [Bacteroidales bacterium]
MEGKIQNAASEWDGLNQLLQYNTDMTEKTNQLTKMLREEQRKEFLNLKQTCEKRHSDHQDVWDMLRENQRLLRESSIRREREWKEADARYERERQEAAKRNEEYERKKQEEEEKYKRERQEFNKEMERMHQEAEKQNRELREQMKVTDMKIQEMSRRFFSTTGHIIEGLMSSASMEMFQKAGFDVYNKAKNLHHKNKSLNAEMEIDVLLSGDTTAVVIEVKASCDRKDVDHVLKQMERFRLLYPEYHDKEVVVAIAAINYELDADIYAHEKNLVVVRADSRNVFMIDPYDMAVLQRF